MIECLIENKDLKALKNDLKELQEECKGLTRENCSNAISLFKDFQASLKFLLDDRVKEINKEISKIYKKNQRSSTKIKDLEKEMDTLFFSIREYQEISKYLVLKYSFCFSLFKIYLSECILTMYNYRR